MKHLLERTELFFSRTDGDASKFIEAVAEHLTALKIVVVCCKLLRLGQSTLFSSFVLFVRMCNNSKAMSRTQAIEIGLSCLLISGKLWERDVTTRQVLTSLSQLLGKFEMISTAEHLQVTQLTAHDFAATECYTLNKLNFKFDVTFPIWDWIEYFLHRVNESKPQAIRDQCSKTFWCVLKICSSHNGVRSLLEFYFSRENVRYFSAAMILSCDCRRSSVDVEAEASSVLKLNTQKLRVATIQLRGALSTCITVSVPSRPTSRPVSSRSSDSKRKRDKSEISHMRMKISKTIVLEVSK